MVTTLPNLIPPSKHPLMLKHKIVHVEHVKHKSSLKKASYNNYTLYEIHVHLRECPKTCI